MWDPETAIDRHVQQDDRVDIKMVQKIIIPKMGKIKSNLDGWKIELLRYGIWQQILRYSTI